MKGNTDQIQKTGKAEMLQKQRRRREWNKEYGGKVKKATQRSYQPQNHIQLHSEGHRLKTLPKVMDRAVGITVKVV